MRGRRAALTAVLIVALLAGALAAGQEGADMRMVDAGFIMRPADTAQKLERLKRLPPLKFVGRTRTRRALFHLRRSGLSANACSSGNQARRTAGAIATCLASDRRSPGSAVRRTPCCRKCGER